MASTFTRLHDRLSRRWRLLGAALVLTAFAGAAGAGSFTTTYRNGSSCLSSYNIKGVEPDASGTNPVFLYFVGTTENYDNANAMAAVNAMAAKGFVAATIQYPNSSFGSCSTIGSRAKCAFNAGSANSAIAKLCSRAKADCSKGIVVAGFSQGSIIATLAKNYDSRVAAAYGLGTHASYSVYDLGSCMANGRHTLPANRLRIVNGEKDTFGGGNAIAVRNQAQTVTGRSCGSSAYECLAADGSGWRMVRDSEVQDRSADHCYMRASGDCVGSQSFNDSGWASGTATWSMGPALNWLNGFVRH